MNFKGPSAKVDGPYVMGNGGRSIVTFVAIDRCEALKSVF